ncbi:MAG TPA: 23S rRNA (pseudouridine(1915)-N(3))-methyltransferase RlmH [Woeseiaceae bacterium]|nr:23S rRNA (pseudouridine(1915)-N(3))-methyltransferase RlmH [Woeseiaceae bacterium]
MHIRMIAVGDRQPGWVGEAVGHYAKRLPVQWRFRVQALPVAVRSGSGGAARAVEAEGAKILGLLKPGERLVALDEHGVELTSAGLAERVAGWQADGRDVCLVIGGPDGLSRACLDRAELCWSLSRHTLPHGLARVLAVEQLYRAWTLLTGHPYHRE